MEIFRKVRRQDRLLDGDATRELLATGEYGFLALCSPEGYGYGIPLHYAAVGNSIYFHCAPEGHKLDAVRANSGVSFCVVGPTQVFPEAFTTRYASVHVFGRVAVVEEDNERFRALRLLVEKYSPEFTGVAEKYINGSSPRTTVLRLDIEHLSGKTNEPHPEL